MILALLIFGVLKKYLSYPTLSTTYSIVNYFYQVVLCMSSCSNMPKIQEVFLLLSLTLIYISFLYSVSSKNNSLQIIFSYSRANVN